jgi:hypothetical protein
MDGEWAANYRVDITVPLAADAPPGNVHRIGRLGAGGPPAGPNRSLEVEAFRQGLYELGYVEGQNILIEDRYAEGRDDRLRDLAAELARLKALGLTLPPSLRFQAEELIQ